MYIFRLIHSVTLSSNYIIKVIFYQQRTLPQWDENSCFCGRKLGLAHELSVAAFRCQIAANQVRGYIGEMCVKRLSLEAAEIDGGR